MGYSKQSLEKLRQSIDLVDVLGSHIQLQRAGGSYKALCPFHEEKSPSFVVQRGADHYHCFGCGAHGDAIAFLMGHLKMSFVEAVESLAERFQIVLEKSDTEEEKGPNKGALRDLLGKAAQLYHFCLLHTIEGELPLKYLYTRGFDLEFIRRFQIGFAPSSADFFLRAMRQWGAELQLLEATALVSNGRPFFTDRITVPIRDPLGAVIGFSARKFKEETFGGKYINTSETILFKKSQVLFGLNYSRQKIAKERRAIIVEGQLDALRLIHAGFDYTVAGQGTAFGEGHVRELMHLGVSQVILAFDGDKAGERAAAKVGDLFQKKGVGVSVVPLPSGSDPDRIIQEEGPPFFAELLAASSDYLPFLFNHLSEEENLQTPAGKNNLVQKIAAQIRSWEQPVMVYESLKKLALLAQIPEEMLGIGHLTAIPLQSSGRVGAAAIDPDRILETDLLRWMFLMGESAPDLIEIIRANLQPDHLRSAICRQFFSLYLEAQAQERPRSLLDFAPALDSTEAQELLREIMHKRVNRQKARDGVIEAIRKILQRQWMQEREEIKCKIQSGDCSEEEVLALARQFDALKKSPPEVRL